jgi:hypothetical protein
LDWDNPAPRLPRYEPGVGVVAPSEEEISV